MDIGSMLKDFYGWFSFPKLKDLKFNSEEDEYGFFRSWLVTLGGDSFTTITWRDESFASEILF